jgi:hypothetical protein
VAEGWALDVIRNTEGQFVKGYSQPEEWIEHQRQKKLGVHYSPKTEFKKGVTPWIKGKHHTEETKKLIGELSLKAPDVSMSKDSKEFSRRCSKALWANPQWRKKNLEAQRAAQEYKLEKQKEAVAKHDLRVAEEVQALKALGFVAIPVYKGPYPDIIAVKDGKAYAIEIEFKGIEWNKWLQPHPYDDVIWVYYRPRKRPRIVHVKDERR